MEYFFYLNDQNERKGPVASEELIKNGVTRNTLVWKEGMAQWLPASEVPELSDLFKETTTPPPVPPVPPVMPKPEPEPEPIGQKPDNLLVWSILTTVLCCLPLGIVAIVYSAKVDNLWNMGKYEEAVKAAQNAKLFCLISLGLGVISFIIGAFTGLMGAFLGA